MQQTNEQKQRIITHLKLLRQQSLSEYLGTNLQSLANKQVIEDILKQFISVHEQQFLTTITNTIMQVKQQYRSIKKQLKQKQQEESLIKIRAENEVSEKYDKQMEVFFQKWLKLQELAEQKSGQRNPMKAINKLFEQLQRSKQCVQDEQSHRAKVIQECQQQKKKVQSLLGEKQYLEGEIQRIRQNIHSQERTNKSLQQQIYQKHIKYDELAVSYKLLEQELTQLESANMSKREMMDFLQGNAVKLRQDGTKLREEMGLVIKEKEKVEEENDKLNKQIDGLKEQISGLKNQINQLKNEIDGWKKQVNEQKKQIDRLMKQIDKLKKEITERQQSEKAVCEKIQQVNMKCLQILQENNQLKQTIIKLQQQIANINVKGEQQRQKYQHVIKQKQQQHSDARTILQSTIQLHKQQMQVLENKFQHKVSQQKEHSQQLGKQIALVIQQKDQQLKTYIDEKDKKIRQIEEELRQLKAQAQEREDHERQYELYLQEIVQLKQKIKVLQPAKYDQQLIMDGTGRPRGLRNKRSKIYFLLTQVQVKLQTLRQQNISLTKSVKQHLMSIASYCSKSIQLITARVYQTKLSCDYCDHHARGSYITITAKDYNHNRNNHNNNNFVNIQQHQQYQQPTLIKPTTSSSNINLRHPQSFGNGVQSLSFGSSSDNQRHYQNYDKIHNHQTQQQQGFPNNLAGDKLLLLDNTVPRSNRNTTPVSSNNTNMLRNVKKLNEKMKLINHQNSTYQLHLSRILSQKTISNPYQ